MCDRMLTSALASADQLSIRAMEQKFGVGILEVKKVAAAVFAAGVPSGPLAGGFVPTLINGRPVDRKAWPEVARITVGNGGCTATLVGPNCALTAAHCGKNGQTGTMDMADGSKVPFTVIQMPQYQDATAQYDLSVLRLDREAPGQHYATVGLSHAFQNGQEVTIAGFGCTQPGGTGGNDGILRVGPSRVVGTSGTDVITEWREQQGAALCFGDSGGPMFVPQGVTGRRTIIAINSKGNIRDTNYNMMLSHPAVKKFLESAIVSYGLAIKGINFSGETPPPPPPPPAPELGKKLEELGRELADVVRVVDDLRKSVGGQVASDATC